MAGNTGPTGAAGAKGGDLNSLVSSLNLSPAAQKALAANIANASSGGSGTGGPTSSTTTTTYAPGSITPTINTIWRQMIGKDASKKEITAIEAAINAAMKTNPDKAYSSGGNNAAISKTAGANVEQIITEQALQNPETAGFQAATTYYDDLMSVLKGPLGGGY